MKVIVPYTTLHPTTRQVLDSYNLDVDYVPMLGDSGYRALLANLWAALEPVIIVEQDILPWPGAIEELCACPCQWGTYSYPYQGGIGIAHMLGCAKLTTGLMAALPNVWDNPAPWYDLDRILFFAARDIGIEPHLHRPPVIHLKGA